MTADSERYIQLQNVYIQQADADAAMVTARCHDLLQSIGRVSFLVFIVTGLKAVTYLYTCNSLTVGHVNI